MNRRQPFTRALITLSVFILLEGLAIILVSNNSIIQQYRLMESVRSCQAFFWRQGEEIRYFFSLKKVNQDLLEQNRMLLDELERTSHYEEGILPLVNDTSSFSLTIARVIKNSVNKQHNYLVIDKGSLDGMKEDMGVITSIGVIGHIKSVGKHYSLVTSFLDINHNVSAIIKRNGTFGPVKWDGKQADKATLVEIPLHTEIIVGDTIVTSGYSTIYPANIPIGTIVDSKLVDGINYHLTIKLFENFCSLNYVYVVKNLSRTELDYLLGAKEGKE